MKNYNREVKSTNPLISSLAVDESFLRYKFKFWQNKQGKTNMVLKACGSQFNLDMQVTEKTRLAHTESKHMSKYILIEPNAKQWYHNQHRYVCRLIFCMFHKGHRILKKKEKKEL